MKVTSGQDSIQLWILQKNLREFPEMLAKVLHVSVSGLTHLFSLLIINMGLKIGYDYYLIFLGSKVKYGC